MADISKLNMMVSQGAPANSAAVSKLVMYVAMQLGTEAGATPLNHYAYTYGQRIRKRDR
jgi:hypothetical protein